MDRMLSWRVVTVALLSMALAAPFAALGSPGTAPAAGGEGAEPWFEPYLPNEGERPRLDELLQQRPATAAQHMEVARTLRRAAGEPASSVREGPVADHVGGTYRLPLGAGDLSGDGLEDVAVVEIALSDFTFTLRGLRGTDGQELWARAFGEQLYDFFLEPAGDLTGDGFADLFLFELFIEEEDEDGSPYLWVVDVVSGADGASAWSLAFDAASGPGPVPLLSFNYRYYFVTAFLSDDHDGDGARDVLAEAVSLENVFATYWYTTEAHLVGGDDGLTLNTYSNRVMNGFDFVRAAGDAVGDATGDFLLEQYRQSPVLFFGPSTLDLVMLDGDDFAEAWRRSFGGLGFNWAYVERLGCDATGDGKEDLLAFVFEELPSSATTRLVSGATGQDAWSKELGGEVFACLGPVGGGPGHDLLALPYYYEFFDGPTATVDLPRIDGATGEPLFTTERTFTDPAASSWVVYFTLSLDADGDGVVDPLLNAFAGGGGHEHEEGNVTPGPATTVALVEAGDEDAVLFRRTADDAFAIRAGDLDADGGDDLYDLGLQGGEPAVRAVALPEGTELWTLQTSAFLQPVGDVSGLGGDDALLARALFANDVLLSRVEAVEGGTGDVLWGFGDALVPVPPDPPQDDAGSGTDAGDFAFDALDIEPGSYAGQVGGDDLADHYRVLAPAESLVRVTVEPLDGQVLDLALEVVFESDFDFETQRIDEREASALPQTEVAGLADARPVIIGIDGDPAAFGEYALTVAVEPLPVERTALQGHLSCMVGRVTCSGDNEGLRMELPVAGTPSFAVLELRYDSSQLLSRVVVDVFVNGAKRAVLAEDQPLAVDRATAARWFGLGGEIVFRAHAPDVGLTGVPGGYSMNQDFEVCAALVWEGEPRGLAC